MEHDLDRRVSELEEWRDSIRAMLTLLSADQAYRSRWLEERTKRYARWQRRAALAGAVAGAIAVVASAVVQLAHLL